MYLTVLIPLFNEEESCRELVERVCQTCSPIAQFEIIVVEDGSTDGSFGELSKLACEFKDLRVIKFKSNAGKSAALHAGFQNSKGKVIITLDADLQNPPEEIPKFLAAIKDTDAVFGLRSYRRETAGKKLASRLANYFRRYLLGDASNDSGCGFKAFKDYTVRDLPLFNGLHRFFPALLMMNGYQYREIEIEDHRRKYGCSKFGNLERTIPALIDLWAVRWMKNRALHYKIEKEI
tara:strand:+ start:172 stop:876 length:705 start_codon:yes stop_codon:yes gene_type:complete